jgi:uncharacterized membrane protein YphA (DoxX/SURF4 family)
MKPRPLTIVIFLLAGVIATVVIAWACALWSPGNEFGALEPIEPPKSWPAYLQSCNWPPPDTAERLTDQGPGVSIISISGGMFLLSGDMRPAGEHTTPYVTLHLHRFGLPARALQWHEYSALGPHSRLLISRARDAAGLRRGLDCPDFLPVRGERASRRLPITPIWSGLFLDAIFYGAVLWLIICGPFAFRRYWRVKRGQREMSDE